MAFKKIARRRFVAGTAATSAAFVAAPFVRSAYAAGKLSVGFWDHWVPNANNATETLIKEWAEKEKVEVTIDFITTQGNKLLLTTPPRRRPNRVTTSWRIRAGCRRAMPTSSCR